MSYFEYAKERYQSLDVNTEEAIAALRQLPISIHCWQGDDVGGFDRKGEALSGGIQATGNYPGKATSPKELMDDLRKAFSLLGGPKKLHLHASYAVFEEGEWADRDAILPRHFAPWVEFAKELNLGLDFNPTLFSHPLAAEYTLTSPDESVRKFWVEHVKRCIEISEYFAEETGQPCVMNIWIPDGLKDIPADRIGPRQRFKQSLDEILSIAYDKEKVLVTLESKVFGIGLESYTAGSAEFCLGYALKNDLTPLLDNGHFHPTELVSDKISSLLLFSDKLALHITRSVRWDSDHVVRLDDETKEIAKEIIASKRAKDIAIALDFFDAGINRIAAWVLGVRSLQKALLLALLTPHDALKELQDSGNFTKLFVLQEQLKTMPFDAVWEEYCRQENIPAEDWYSAVEEYEKTVLSKREAK